MVVRYEYRCPNCEYEFLANEPFPVCPKCGFDLKEENE